MSDSPRNVDDVPTCNYWWPGGCITGIRRLQRIRFSAGNTGRCELNVTATFIC